MKDVINFLSENWGWLAPLLYEVAVRLFPTEKSLSLINFLKGVTDKVIPNLKKDPETGDIVKHK